MASTEQRLRELASRVGRHRFSSVEELIDWKRGLQRDLNTLANGMTSRSEPELPRERVSRSPQGPTLTPPWNHRPRRTLTPEVRHENGRTFLVQRRASR